MDSSPFIDASNFSENATGIYNGTTCYLMVQNSNIYNNPTYGLNNANTLYTVSASQNWWGKPTGPTHASNPSGTGDRVSNLVNFTPFAADPFLPLPAQLPATATPPTLTTVGGAISTNTTWTLANSPYLVTGDVTVNVGISLTIEPGVIVKFAAGKNLSINGIMNATGTAENRIYFTSFKDDGVGGDSNLDGTATWAQPGDWGRIFFAGTVVDSQTKLIQAVVRYGGSTGAVQTDASSPTITDNLITRNSSFGLRIANTSAPSVLRNWILDNQGGGIQLATTSYPSIQNNEIWGNTGYAVHMDSTCYPTLANNVAFYNDQNGVRTTGAQTFIS